MSPVHYQVLPLRHAIASAYAVGKDSGWAFYLIFNVAIDNNTPNTVTIKNLVTIFDS